MKRPLVAVLDPIAEVALSRLSEFARVLPAESCRNGSWRTDAEAVIVRKSRITAADLQVAQHLRVIGKHGVGVDNIDVEAASLRGIQVVNTPNANAASVAELAIGLMLALARAIPLHDRQLRLGLAPGPQQTGIELMGAPVGLIGFGSIAREVARRLHFGFGARVLAFDPYLTDEGVPDWVSQVDDLKELLGLARIVSVHVPLLPQTRGLIGASELAAMGPGSFLVNCARGGIVDEHALAEALTSGHLAGAACDVFLSEPPSSDHPLLACERFIGTPHIGASTREGLERVGLEIVDRIREVLGHR